MAKKEFTYKGKTVEDLKTLSHKEFALLTNARARRSIMRGFNDREKKLLKDVKANKRNIETHSRDMIIMPEMIGATIKVYTGKSFEPVLIEPEMIGQYLGAFALSRKKVGHSSPGVGGTQGKSGAKKK